MKHYQILIIGGGTAGLTVAAQLRNRPEAPEVAIIEPSEKHYYQPIWTLIGAGVFDASVSVRAEADYIPTGATWIHDRVETFEPEQNRVTTATGEQYTYDVLVVAAGIQLDWDKIPGLKESVGQPGTGVVSNYLFDSLDATWTNIQQLKRGTAIFTHPNAPIKCGGAPLKIAYLASDYWRKHGVLSNIKVKFIKGGATIFDVKKYADTLTKVSARYGMECVFMKDLTALRPEQHEAVFLDMTTGKEHVERYDMIHVTPPMSAPDFIKRSPLAAESGWADVDKETTQHLRYANVFALGDASSLPTSKTGAAVRKQAPVTVDNIMAYLNHQPLTEKYDGYTSCPLITGYGSLVMAEFDYDKVPQESFPFDQSRERYSMYALKAYALPRMYWHGMLRGREF